MNICNFEAIQGFDSLQEYLRFCKFLESQIQSLIVEEVAVEKLQILIPFGFEEKWYRCKTSGDVWRLVAPEFPFRGLWNLVENYSAPLNENRATTLDSTQLDSDEMKSLIASFQHIETQIGIKITPEFYVFICQFGRQTTNPNFSNLFNKFRFCSEDDVRNAIKDFVPDYFMPFFVNEHDGFDDYYCFGSSNINDKNRVIVYSQDAIVFEWDSYSDFLMWIQDQIDI